VQNGWADGHLVSLLLIILTLKGYTCKNINKKYKYLFALIL